MTVDMLCIAKDDLTATEAISIFASFKHMTTKDRIIRITFCIRIESYKKSVLILHITALVRIPIKNHYLQIYIITCYRNILLRVYINTYKYILELHNCKHKTTKTFPNISTFP